MTLKRLLLGMALALVVVGCLWLAAACGPHAVPMQRETPDVRP